ncbi:SLC13 family permease [Nitrococcus mobilis]|uniref:TrkA-C, di-and tricarboxylate transporter n=1 Tax=Nitrococcus mobilis Nb-231 TaxID=314278 RepID=A4BVP3_9GAMM|nr:SLC13 family permease [Nitrococcus mobilis]EAR20225.1 TrkA-C, di- and tricarboxylate transporter [Nitrococcus mobilis Nb-231]
MSWEAWLTIGVTAGILYGLLRNLASPVFLLFGALAVLMTVQALTGSECLLTANEAVAGFGNSGLVTVGLLFGVVAGLLHTGALTLLTEPLLGRPKSLFSAQLRLLIPVATLSAFLNNTPIVAMFLPVVDDLCKRSRLPPSRLFLPLSYAAIFGGTCTLIGTSTNLVVNGLVQSQAHIPGLALFDLAWIGVPAAALGLVYIFLFSTKLLPAHQPALSMDDDPRRYTAEVIVEPGGPLIGKSVEQAGLRHLPGLFLVEIERDGQVLPAVGPTETLQDGDRLVFVGIVESVVDLHRMRGIQPATNQVFRLREPRSERVMVEAVVSNECPIVGKSIREGRFRAEYDAAVIAVARGGRHLKGKIGEIVLLAGDTLLLETHPSFVQRQRNARDFFLVSRVENSTPRRHEKAGIAVAILVGMVGLAASGVLSMLNAALLAGGCMVVTGCVTGAEVKRSIDWSVLLVIGAALGVGQALNNSGAAETLAGGLIQLAGGHPWLVLLAVFVVTSLFTETITNNAAAVLVFPIAMSAAATLGVSFTPFIVAIMIAASASFSTPLGYQTNMMVYGPGGYRALDYLRFGLPLNFLMMATTVGLAPLVWPF